MAQSNRPVGSAAPASAIGTIGGGPSPAAAPYPMPAPVSGPVQSGAQGFTGYATFGRRVGAYVIDAIPAWIITVIGYAVLFLSGMSGSLRGVYASVGILLVVPMAYFIVLWVMAAKGNSPGNAVLGIRVVREATGSDPGFGLGLGRLLLKGLLIGITFYIGGFSPLWDKTGRRKGWWDSACATVVLDRDAVPAYRATVSDLGPVLVTGLTAGSGPSAGYPHGAGVPESVHPPFPGDIGPDTPIAGRDWNPTPAASAPTPSWPAPEAGTSGRMSDSDAAVAPAAAVADVVTSVPGFGARVAPGPLSDGRAGETAQAVQVHLPAESADHTMLGVDPQMLSTPKWTVVMDDGRTLSVDGPVVIGRDPSELPAEARAVIVRVAEDARSVSKTHLLLDVGPGGVRVTDHNSTNGVVVDTAGVGVKCVPGVPVPVSDGSTVRFGDRTLVIRQASDGYR